MAIEIVSFPINSMVIFHSYVSLPEGNSHNLMVVLWITLMFAHGFMNIAVAVFRFQHFPEVL